MSISSTATLRIGLSRIGYSLVGLGVVAGIVGWVKAGAIIIAIGSAGVSLSRDGRGKIERFMPLVLALALLALAISLPGNG